MALLIEISKRSMRFCIDLLFGYLFAHCFMKQF